MSLATELWDLYADEFKTRWGMDREVSAIIGARSKSLWAAEYKEIGDEAYRTSVILPIRNAFYAASQMDERWSALSKMDLAEPILDYGCGVGFQLLWLKRKGFTQLYGYEIDGVQHDILLNVLSKNGISEWDGEKVNTVLCTNVLEHVADPVGLLEMLLMVGKRVIANVCTDHDESHIAPHKELERCRLILKERNTLYEAAA